MKSAGLSAGTLLSSQDIETPVPGRFFFLSQAANTLLGMVTKSFSQVLGRLHVQIRSEVRQASTSELEAYLNGASRDGTFNRLHNTWRIAQRDVSWLEVLQEVLGRLGARGWIYREGNRDVHVIETTHDLRSPNPCEALSEMKGFCRGYFDAEGGIPRDPEARFYIQMVQKEHTDLCIARDYLGCLNRPGFDGGCETWKGVLWPGHGNTRKSFGNERSGWSRRSVRRARSVA